MSGSQRAEASARAVGDKHPAGPGRGVIARAVVWPRVIVLGLLIGLLMSLVAPALSPAEFSLLDLWMRRRPARPGHPDIVLVGIQKTDTDEWAATKPADCACLTISRARLGQLITALKRADASAVGVDIMLQVPCPHGAASASGHDRVLARALDAPGPEVVLVMGANPTPDKLYFNRPAPAFMGTPQRPRLVASPVLYNPHGVIRGVRMIQVGLPSELQKRAATPLDLLGEQVPPLAAALLAAHLHQPDEMPTSTTSAYEVTVAGAPVPVWPAERLALWGARLNDPTAGSHAMLISWAGPTGTFPAYTLAGVLAASPEELRQRFGGKVVLVGNLAERKFAPIHGVAVAASGLLVNQQAERTISGTEIHANALDTMLQRRFVDPVQPLAQLVLLLVLACLGTVAFQVLSETVAIGFSVALLVGLQVTAFALIARDVWLPTVIPSATLITSGVVSAFWGYARVRHEAEDLVTEVELRDAVTETIVHDLKQPLAAIAAMATVLRNRQRQGGALAESTEFLERILSQVDRAIGDIDGLLSASPGRELGLVRGQFDLLQMVQELARFQSLKSAYHTVEVRSDLDALWLEADLRLIGRLVNNLLDNAIKYWPEGGAVRVEVARVGEWAELRVIDKGLGISPEQKQRIFARFSRAVPDGVDIPGMGIGLYSVHRIVAAHGGTVGVESEVGVGSTFVVRLPIGEAGGESLEGGREQ